MSDLERKIDKLLPQTQCGECGYSGCAPYAKAIAQGEAPIDKCPPGGLETLRGIGGALGIDTTPYEAHLSEKIRPPSIVKIVEAACIGCTKCIQACPVDAIVGTGKKMHTVIEEDCTGCELCIPACPVDCIEKIPLSEPNFDKELAKRHFEARNARLEKLAKAKRHEHLQKRDSKQSQDKLDYIRLAIERKQQQAASRITRYES